MHDFRNDPDFLKEEIRDGHTVSRKMKAVWACELDLLQLFDRFCRDHGLHYTVDYGTLLGAVRHHGFIPWDDDIDVSMPRPDYDRMMKIADSGFDPPYYFQHIYKNPGMCWGMAKLMNDATSCIEPHPFPPEYHCGIFIDIFPMDDVPDDPAKPVSVSKMLYETWLITQSPEKVPVLSEKGYQFSMPQEMITRILSMSTEQKGRLLEGLLSGNDGQSERVNWFPFEMDDDPWPPSRLRSWYSQTITLSFEGIEVPAPVGWDDILRVQYGEDYMIPQKKPNLHAGAFFDPDRPWTEYR